MRSAASIGLAALLLTGCATPKAAQDLAGKTSGFLATTVASAPALQRGLQARNSIVNRRIAFERTLEGAAIARSAVIERQWAYIDSGASARKQRLLAIIRSDDAKLSALATPPAAAPPQPSATAAAIAPEVGPVVVLLTDIATARRPTIDAVLSYGTATNKALRTIETDAAKLVDGEAKTPADKAPAPN